MAERRLGAELRTLGLLIACYGVWALVLTWPVFVAVPILALVLTLHSSLQHEALHGHPTPYAAVNSGLVFPALGLFIPYLRFRDTHLAHHRDAHLTDPYDDPESNYLDPAVWSGLSAATRAVLRANNTLAGRMVLGPVIGQWVFMRGDWRLIRQGDRRVLLGWLLHLPAVGVVFGAVLATGFPVWAYLLAAYCAMSVLKIRTFLEHQAHENAAGRTVIIEDRGPLALLFLNNNLHVVHHMHPSVAWCDLPALYQSNKARFTRRNFGYVYRSYSEIFRRHFLRAKDPVPHPQMKPPAG